MSSGVFSGAFPDVGVPERSASVSENSFSAGIAANGRERGIVPNVSARGSVSLVSHCSLDARARRQQLFGYKAENQQVGITGEVDFVALDGPTVVLRLSGRFWHEKSTVLARVGNFLTNEIPEICDVQIEDPAQLDDADPLKEQADF